MPVNTLYVSTKNIFKTVLIGIGQIMLQENAVTGILFLAGIFIGSFYMGLAALLAAITGTLTSYLLKYNTKEINSGLYGFSPALVGVAVMLFLKPVFIAWIIIVIGSALAAMLQNFFIKKNIAAFTFPFVIVTWIIYYSVSYIYPGLLSESNPLVPSEIDKYLFAVKGFGQVIFQANIFSGALFVIGVFFHSRIAGLYGILGAIIAAILAFYFTTADSIANGIISYNAVLCAIALAGKELKNILWAFIATAFSVILLLLMMKFNILALTFPFVLGTYLTLLIKNSKN